MRISQLEGEAALAGAACEQLVVELKFIIGALAFTCREQHAAELRRSTAWAKLASDYEAELRATVADRARDDVPRILASCLRALSGPFTPEKVWMIVEDAVEARCQQIYADCEARVAAEKRERD